MRRYFRNVLIILAASVLLLAGSSWAIQYIHHPLLGALALIGILVGIFVALGAFCCLIGLTVDSLFEWWQWARARKMLGIRHPRSDSEWGTSKECAHKLVRERAISFLNLCDQEVQLQGWRQDESAADVHKRLLQLQALTPQLEAARVLFNRSLKAAVSVGLVDRYARKSVKLWAGRE